MAVKLIAKEKAKADAKSKVDPEIAVLVEKMYAAKKKADEAKKDVMVYDAIRKELLLKIPDDAPADQEYAFMGETHKAVFSAKGTERSVEDIQKLRTALGDEVFFQIINLNWGDVDKYLSEEEQKGLVSSDRTGPRKCSMKDV